MKNPIFFWLIMLFTLANFIDSVTALFILPGEANPLFLLTGSIWIVLIGKILLVSFVWFLYHRNIFPSNIWYYFLIASLMFGTMVMSLGAYSNILGIQNPDMVVAAAKMEKTEKIKDYFFFGSVVYLIPIIVNFLVFIVYEKSRPKTIIDYEYYKKKKWWEF